MHLPIAILETKKIQRIVFCAGPSSPSAQSIYPLMEKVYEMGAWSFSLPTVRHLEAFKKLHESTLGAGLLGFGHLEAESGLSLLGKPLHRFESRIVSTVIKNIVPSDSVRKLFPVPPSGDVLTQKEIDRMVFDAARFDQALSLYPPEEVPFLLIGGKYGDWLLGLGRGDLLKEMVSEARRKGFIPIFSGLWTTFVLPKAKALDVAGFAIPVNKRKSLFDLTMACDLIKKFVKPVISLDPLAGGKLSETSDEAFSFLFNELRVHSAFVEITSEEQAKNLLKGVENIPSLIPFRKT